MNSEELQDQKEDKSDPLPSASEGWSLHYMTGDLFSCPADEALAHCISEDCRMGAGIATIFKKKFAGVAELKAQQKTPGECAVLSRGGRWVYYLVRAGPGAGASGTVVGGPGVGNPGPGEPITKKKASQKPTYDALRQSLEAMKLHCLENGVGSLSMPRIGCGLDRLKWEKVSLMLEEIFRDTNICITVYTL